MRGSPGLFDSDHQQYHWDSATAAQKGKVECSLVTSVEQAAPDTLYGPIVGVPNYGNVSFAELAVDRAFHSAMVDADAGSSGGGTVTGPKAMANGRNGPGATGPAG